MMLARERMGSFRVMMEINKERLKAIVLRIINETIRVDGAGVYQKRMVGWN